MASAHLLQQASQHLRSGNVASADQLLSPLLAGPPQHDVLHMLGVVRFHQSRNEEAVTLITKALALENKPQAQFSLGRALASQGRQAEAAAAYRAFVALSPNPAQAQFELAICCIGPASPRLRWKHFAICFARVPAICRRYWSWRVS